MGNGGWYTLNGRRVQLSSRGANVMVFDAVVKQPLLDYLQDNGQNEEWEPLPETVDVSIDGREFIAFSSMPLDRRLTFGNDLRGGPGLPPIQRLSAMRIAAAMAV